MARKAATGGGDWTDLEELADRRTLVVFRILEFLPEEPGKDRSWKPNQPVVADVLIASGPRRGEVTFRQKIIKGGVTNTLRADGNAVGDEIMTRLEIKAGASYIVAQTPSPVELAAIDALYEEGDPWAAAKAKTSAPAASASAPVDDEPPF